MEFRAFNGFTIFLLTLLLIKHLRAAAIDIPLISKLNAPLKAELDICFLTTQLKELIGNEVKQAVSIAMKDFAESIVDNKTQSALENLQTLNNLTISPFLQEMEVTMTAYPASGGTISNTIMKFDDVKHSVGITNLSSYKTTGKFTCEHEGLYLISVSVMSYTSGAHYYIKLNGNIISHTYIGTHRGFKLFTGAVTINRKLNPNEQVWLYDSGSWHFDNGLYFKLTIIKIKCKYIL